MIANDRSIPVVGGAEVQQALIAASLARHGYRVSMICLDYGQAERAQVRGVTVYKMHKPAQGIPVLRFLHPRLTSLWRTLRRVDADIYYQRTSGVATGILAAFCARHNKRSIYAGASDVDFLPGAEQIRFARDRWIFRYGLRHVDRIFVQNSVQRERVLAHYGRDSALIQNCYAAPPGAHADRAGYVLWAGALRPQKRPEVLLEIARRLPQHRFVVMGGGDPGRAGEAYAAALRSAAAGLANVQWLGFLPFSEADERFNGARLLVSTSAFEGFPNTFLQAWARGVPTVGFVDTGSRRDGRPVSQVATDLEQACAEIARLMQDDLAWRDASQRSLAHFREHHSVEAALRAYEPEIERLMRR